MSSFTRVDLRIGKAGKGAGDDTGPRGQLVQREARSTSRDELWVSRSSLLPREYVLRPKEEPHEPRAVMSGLPRYTIVLSGLHRPSSASLMPEPASLPASEETGEKRDRAAQ